LVEDHFIAFVTIKSRKKDVEMQQEARAPSGKDSVNMYKRKKGPKDACASPKTTVQKMKKKEHGRNPESVHMCRKEMPKEMQDKTNKNNK